MPPTERTEAAAEHLAAFAARTGMLEAQPPEDHHRYLWTDAFAVCTWLGLARQTGQERYARQARELIDRVHHTLGRHRPDDEREGWLSGLEDAEAELHPTAGGLRIGKPLPERASKEPVNRRSEWDRDGQYFHYLTRWMHALTQAGRALGEARLTRWAHELAEAAWRGFALPSPSGQLQLAWKMSIDLTRPQLPSTGHHDPLDGWQTFERIALDDAELDPGDDEALAGPRAELRRMCRGTSWLTDDPLGLGGLLLDLHRGLWLVSRGRQDLIEQLEPMASGAGIGLSRYVRRGSWEADPERRLPFRELGLALGLRALPGAHAHLEAARDAELVPPSLAHEIEERLVQMREHTSLAQRLEDTWRDPDARQASSWQDHQDINQVMLAASLCPTGYLDAPPAPA